MSLKKRLMSASSKLTKILDDSDIFKPDDFSDTGIPIINMALSGDIDGGLGRGITTIGAPSKHFKTMLGLLMVKTYLEKHDDAMCIFYDSEYGARKSYFDSYGIDASRVIHTPIDSLEGYRSDLAKHLKSIKKGDKVILLTDSIGNIPSSKEIEDAENEKTTVDMTRAKTMKSVLRIACLQVNIKNIPMILIGHTYKTMEMYSKQILSGGEGIVYNSDNILFIGRRQNKKDGEVLGYEFVITLEKSRFAQEGTKLPFKVTFEEGIYQYSGLLDFALDGGYVIKPKNGWYSRPSIENDKNFREKEIDRSKEFWQPIFENTDFKEFVRNKLQLAGVIISTGGE